MPTLEKKPLIILACILAALILVGAGYLVYMHFWGTPKVVPIKTFVCADGSHYIIIEEKDKILVSGNTFKRIEESSRYSNGISEVELTADAFVLRDLETGEEVVTCPSGIPETGVPPVMTAQQ